VEKTDLLSRNVSPCTLGSSGTRDAKLPARNFKNRVEKLKRGGDPHHGVKGVFLQNEETLLLALGTSPLWGGGVDLVGTRKFLIVYRRLTRRSASNEGIMAPPVRIVSTKT